jgi:hypothetical protein
MSTNVSRNNSDPPLLPPPRLSTQALKRKAEERNPDEFYFAMQSKRTKEGVHDGRSERIMQCALSSRRGRVPIGLAAFSLSLSVSLSLTHTNT